MELKKLDKSVLKLWYVRAAMASLALLVFFVGLLAVLIAAEAPGNVTLAVSLGGRDPRGLASRSDPAPARSAAQAVRVGI